MENIKKVLFIIAFLLVCCSPGFSQVFVERMPDAPHNERMNAPSPRHVWIDEDWEPRNGSYVYVGGRWAEPPNPGGRWIQGHWKHKRKGWMWIAGHWR